MSTSKRRCSICGRRRVLTRLPGDVCAPCARRFGLPAEPPDWPRPRSPCARCGHGVLVACIVRQRVAGGPLAPLAASFERRLKTQMLTGEEYIEYEPAPDHAAPRGLFVAYVCRGCGFTEWYALNPESIPVGPAYGTHLVVADRTPYR